MSGSPSAPAAVPGVSGLQQRQEASRSGRRRRRSSSDGIDRRSKKCPRGRSPSPGPSSAVGRSTIGLPPVLRRKIEPMFLLPELEVLLAIFAPLRRMTVRRVLNLRVGRHDRPLVQSAIDQALVVDPPLLRERRMMTGRVPSIR